MYQCLHKEEKGFTLVELMVVIIILAVLTGISVPSYLALRNRARIQATRSEMQDIATVISVYEADRSGFPVATTVAAMATALEDVDTSGDDVYVESCPTEDAWDTSYTYTGTADTYTLTSTAGTSDDTTDDIIIIEGTFTTELKSTLPYKKKGGKKRDR